MAGWNKICCAIDFSEASRFALEQAADLARRFEAELTLVHVHEPRRGVIEMPKMPRELDAGLAEMDLKMEGWRAEAERIAGRPVLATVLSGKPATEIPAFVRNGNFDALVVAANGRGGLKSLVLGSVCERLVREAECTVVVARRPLFAPD